MYLRGMPKRKAGSATQETYRKRAWKVAVWLLLLALLVAPLIGTPVGAAPMGEDPAPPEALASDPSTGEETEGFIEFGPPSGDAVDESVALDMATAPLASPALAGPTFAGVPAAPAGFLPSYDEEALAKFDSAKAIESVRHLAVDIGPRVTGTPQEREAAQYLGGKLESYGFEVTYRNWAAGSTKNVAKVTSPNADLPGGPNWQMSRSTSAKITGDDAPVEGAVIYAGNGQSASNFPPDTAGKIVMMDYSTYGTTRNTAVVNAVSRGAVGVILAQTGTNAAPPSAFSLTTPQPDVPVVGAGRAHGDWIKALIAQGPLTLSIATNSYTSPQGTNVVGVRHAVNDPTGTTAPIIMVGGHIDSVLGAPGSHDNATGPSSAVEIGRVLSQYALDKEIRIVGYGGEEIGMYGSKAYVASLTAAERARFVGAWDMDMEGTPYPPAGFWALTPNGQSNYVVQSAYDAAARAGFTDMRNCRLGQSDHQSFYDAGIPASLFIWLDYRPNVNGCGYNGSYVTEPQYHRPTDTMDNVSPERLQISLNVVGGAAFHSALNAVTLSATAGGAAVEANCGDGWRYLGETNGGGAVVAAIPHATCDFKANKGLAVSMLDDVPISGDRSLTFPAFHLPDPVLLHGSASPTHGTIGVDWASCGELDTSSVGAKTITCTDDAGNSAGVEYNVIYNFSSFSPPVDNPSTLNTANSGQAIPLKWQIADVDGNPVTDLASVLVTAETLSCPTGTTEDSVQEYAPGASGLQNLGNGNYQFNWQTPKTYAQSCKTMKLDLGEGPGMERTALFNFTK